MALIWMVVLVSLSMSSAISPFYPSVGSHGEAVRCSAASKPCRIKVDLHGGATGQFPPQVIEAQLCTCNGAKACSTDWVEDASRVITRELNSNNMEITLRMMFCNEVQPQALCNENDTALQVAGYSNLPLEVDFFRCSCADSRPLVLDESFYGEGSRLHMKYVCPNFKRRCNMRRTVRDDCIVSADRGDRTMYPCKCPTGTACEVDFVNSTPMSPQYRCVWQ